MSADNTIVVLGTVSEWVTDGAMITRAPKHEVYRVAHLQAWDNFEWYKEKQQYNLGHYLWCCFRESAVYTDKASALIAAERLYNEIGYVEYGIQIVDTEYEFPTD